MGDTGLSDKHKAFCVEYLRNGFNGKQAAITVGYSEVSATSTASEILTYPNVRLFIDKSVDFMLSDKKELTKQLIDEMKKYAFMSPEQMEIEQVRPSDKKGYVEMLCKYLTLFTEKKEIQINDISDKKLSREEMIEKLKQSGIELDPIGN